MTEEEYHRYVAAFNARDYQTLETFFTDDFVLENAGFKVVGKPAFRAFYRFFHEYCRETVTLRKFFQGGDAVAVNAVIRFEGLKALSPQVLADAGYPGMTPVPEGAIVDLDFIIIYYLDEAGLIQAIKGAVHEPARDDRLGSAAAPMPA